MYWFDMPLMFEDQGGFSNREVCQDFVNYCQQCFSLFSDIVDIWFIYNEPLVDIGNKYLGDACYPNEVNMAKSGQVTYNMVVTQARVVQLYKKMGIKGPKLSTVLPLSKTYPRSNNPFDLAAKRTYDLLLQDVWTEPMLGGKYPEQYLQFFSDHGMAIDTEPDDQMLIENNTISVLGINHYAPNRVKARDSLPNPVAPLLPESFYSEYDMPGATKNPYRGWEIYPPALYDTLKDLDRRYPGLEMYVTENGMGVQNEARFRNESGQINDTYRIDYLKDYILSCWKAIQEGVQLKGYHTWSFIDLWSPSNQFLNSYGLVEFDPKQKEVKGIKKSGEWYRHVIDQNGLD